MRTRLLSLRGIAVFGAVALAVMLASASTVRAETVAESITIDASTGTTGAEATYTITVTLGDDLEAADGGYLGFSINGSCREEANFDTCSPDFTDAVVDSADFDYDEFSPHEDDTPSGGTFNLSTDLVAGEYEIVISGIVNGPEQGAYSIWIHSGVAGEEEPEEDDYQPPLGVMILGTPVIQGTVYESDGTTPIGCGESRCPWVSAHTEDWSVESGSTPDSQGNFYIFGLDPGNYQLSVYMNPPLTGQTAPAEPTVTVVEGETVTQNITFVNATKTVRGVVKDKSGDPVDDAQVWVSGRQGGGWTSTMVNDNGSYSLSVASGSYEVGIEAGWNEDSGGQMVVDWMNLDDRPREVSFANDDTEETQTVNFTVVRTTSTVTGRVLLPNGELYGRDVWVRLSGKEGRGNGASTNESSRFSIPITAGTYHLEINVWGTSYYGPDVKVTVGENETVNLGDISLREMTSRVTGTVIDQDGNPLSGMQVFSWGTTGFAEGQTDANGVFSMGVPAGNGREIHVEDTSRTYINSGPPIRYNIKENETVNVGTIILTRSNARIFCTAVDTNGNRLNDMYGWVELFVSDGPPVGGGELSRGTCGAQGFPVLAGTYEVEVFTERGGDYSLVESPTVTVPADGSVDVELVFAENDAVITGKIMTEEGEVITGVEMFVFAENWSAGTFYEGFVNPDNGQYRIDMLGGQKITLGTFVPEFLEDDDDDAPRFLNGPSTGEPVLVGSGQTVTRNIKLPLSDASLVGQVFDPNGNLVPHGFVWCSSISPEQFLEGGEDIERGELFSGSEVMNGSFDVPVTSTATWNCGTGKPPAEDWLSANIFEFAPDSGDIVSHNFRFEIAAGTIHGSVTFEDGTTPDDAWVVAFSNNGKFTETFVSDGAYTLPISGNTTWTVMAETDHDEEFYRSDEAEVSVGSSPDETVNLTLKSFFTIPPSYTTTFDVATPLNVRLQDGFTLQLPANAAGSEGTATITIQPMTGLARDKTKKPPAYGYNISVLLNGSEVTELSESATMTFPYNEDVLERQGIDEDNLTGMFYDDSLGSWSGVQSVQVNTESNTITITVSHFSTFATISNGGATAAGAGTASANNYLYITGRSTAGPNVRIVDETGEQIESFMAYTSTLRGGWKAVGGDVNGDGIRDVVTATGTGQGPHVRAFNQDGTLIADFMAYDSAFRGGVNVITADVNGNGKANIVVAPENGTGNVRVYSYNATTESFDLLAWKMAYDAGYTGGVNLVAADVDGDGAYEIVTAPATGAANVRVYSYNATTGALDLDGWSMVYDSAFRGGVNLAAGDVDNDGKQEIITVPRLGASNVRVLNVDSGIFSTLTWFFAYDTGYKNGTQLAVGNLDGVGGAEVITAPTFGSSNVRAYIYDSTNTEMDLLDWGFAYDEGFKGGVNLVATDMDGDSKAELAVAPREGTPNVRVYEWESDSRTLVDWFWGFAQTFKGGVNLGY